MYTTSRVSEIVFLLSEVIVVVLYATCTEYGEGMHPKSFGNEAERAASLAMVTTYYPMF